LAYLSTQEATAEFFLRIGYIGVSYLPIGACHFMVAFIDTDKGKNFLRGLFISGALFAFFLITTDWFMTGTYKYFWGYYPKVSLLHPIYLTLLACFATYLTGYYQVY